MCDDDGEAGSDLGQEGIGNGIFAGYLKVAAQRELASYVTKRS